MVEPIVDSNGYDHVDLDTSGGSIDARLYLTWYQDMSIQPKFEILNGKRVYHY
ncbi:hypothetical protein AKUH4B507X_PKUN00150 (plasmid) [Apilactobacillus kunkeei]|nr:hypothetical protein AKUH4B507X_PKUN00150 [Apilactobacillus kunkeei]